VLDLMISHEDLVDDDDHLLARDMLYAEDLAERFEQRDTRDVAERAAAAGTGPTGTSWSTRCWSRTFPAAGSIGRRR
jgi:hypothetical protein